MGKLEERDRGSAQGGTNDMVDSGLHPMRRLLMALVMIGCVGLAAELLLLEHTETVYQWLPLIVLAVAFVTVVALAVHPTRAVLRAFQGIMLAALAIGGLGVYLHYSGNTEFELEMHPTMQGLGLAWNALRGATPALAPGALLQLGLIGLIASYRHPLLRHGA